MNPKISDDDDTAGPKRGAHALDASQASLAGRSLAAQFCFDMFAWRSNHVETGKLRGNIFTSWNMFMFKAGEGT